MVELLGQNGILTALLAGGALVLLLAMASRASARNKAARSGRDDGVNPAEKPDTSSQTAGSIRNAGVVAAITAAVNEYRKNNI